MDNVKLLDMSFSHSILGYCSDFQKSDNFIWDRENIDYNYDTIVYTDLALSKATNNGKSYAWLIEPMCINKSSYDYVIRNINTFKKIFTHEKELLDMGEPFEMVPFGCCWIDFNEQKIYNKKKDISIISSDKKITDGHMLRHNIISKYGDNINVYGRGYNPIEFKINGLKDYRFNIVVENCKRDYWFTEKLIDCFRTGTIPIYWGCPSIGDFFDLNGIITFNHIDDLKDIIYNLNEDVYNLKLESVINNFNEAKKYILPDDIIYNKLKENK
jgi:hypothetical protein